MGKPLKARIVRDIRETGLEDGYTTYEPVGEPYLGEKGKKITLQEQLKKPPYVPVAPSYSARVINDTGPWIPEAPSASSDRNPLMDALMDLVLAGRIHFFRMQQLGKNAVLVRMTDGQFTVPHKVAWSRTTEGWRFALLLLLDGRMEPSVWQQRYLDTGGS